MRADFSGNYTHALDAKGRAIVPAPFRALLSERFAICLNNDLTSIAIYPEEKWERLGALFAMIPETDAAGMRFKRLKNGYSYPDSALDTQGRLMLPQTLRGKVGIGKTIRFVGAGDYFEIWDDRSFQEHCAEIEQDLDAIQAHINANYERPSQGGQLPHEKSIARKILDA